MKLINSSISRSRIFWVAIACLLPVFNLHAFNYGKIDASQGVACNACHSGGLAPSVSLTGPANVAPGSVNRFTIMVSGGQQNQGGFNVAVSDGTVRAVTAGSWVTNNQVHHYTPGIANANGVISWQFDWTAPATDSTVVIYAAGLSTDASGSQTGDAAATTTLTVTVGNGGNAPPTTDTGESLYAGNCQACHGAAPGPKAGRTAAQIQNAIGSNTGGMGALSSLTAAQIQMISDFLGGGGNTPQAPVADAGGPYVGTVGQQVLFDGSASSDIDGTVVDYAWDFGDGNTATGASPAHTYSAVGLYTVTLTVTDNSGMTGVITTTANIAQDTPPAPVYDGAALYGTNCSGCHGPLATSTKSGRTAAQIQNAINTNTGGMGNTSLGLVNLIPAEVQAIADALGGGGNTPQAPTANAGAAYSGVVGTAVQFNGAASFDADGNIVSYSWDFGDGNTGTGVSPTHTYATSGLFTVNLTVTDNDGLTGIASTTANIGTNTPPPPVLDGVALYNQNCSGCHGAAPGTKTGRTAQQIQNAIGVVQAMSGLSGLTSAEIQAIADAISNGGNPTPTDGEGLYNAYCSSCHGAEGRGGAEESVRGASARSIRSAISGERDMQYLGGLISDTEINLISDYLNGRSSGGGEPEYIQVTKKSIYDQYCSGCHGAEGRGGTEEGVRGASTSSITRAISSERDMNFLSGLTDQYIRAISDYLNGDSNGTIQIPALGGGGATDGLALYGTNCSGCHGAAPGTKSGRTAQQIQNAINTVGAMSGLTGLTAAEVQSIADAIATGGGGGGGGGTTPPDGATLYANNCSGCHGNAPGTKAGRTAQQIQNAINTVGAMSGLTGLTAAEVQAIADAIATGGGGGGGGGTTPPDGATLYADNCSGCHGNAPGTKAGRTAQQIQSAINTVGAMSGLTGLTAAEVQAIADAIATGGGGGGGGGTTPPDGTTLYADNCSGCHGNAPGTKAGRTAQQIQSAINSVGAMSGLTGLTATEVQAIADAIGGTNAPPTTPEGLFTSYCSACHGIDGRGGVGGNVRGSSASDIQRAINSERDMNYLSGLLAESTIQSIADYLGGGTSTRTTTRRRSREDGQAGNGTPSTAGGCSLGSNAPFDPLLPLLVLSGLGYLFRRPARQQG